MQLFPSKLRSRLLILVGLAIIPTIILIGYSGLEQRQALLDESEHDAMHLAEVTASGLEQMTLRTKAMLSLLAQIPQVNQMDKCNSLFASLLNHVSPYANIGLIRMNGTVACSALPFSQKVRLNDRLYFKRAISSGGFSIGNFQLGRITHKESINFAYPVFDKQKQMEGILFAALPLQWIYNDLIKSGLPKWSTANVIDPSRQLSLSIHGLGGRQEQSLAGSPLLDEIRAANGRGIALMKDLNGISRAFVFTTIPGLPKGQEIYINIGLPVSFIYAKADRVTIRNIMILFVVAGLVFLIAWKGGDVFVLRQIAILLAATRELGMGKLNARAQIVSYGGELSELVSSFNLMAESLEKQTHGINRLNRIYAVLSNINGTILRVRNKIELAQEACRIAVEHGRFNLAWIGFIDEADQHLKPVASMGEHDNLVRNQFIPLQGDDSDGIFLAGKAVEKKHDIIINNIGDSGLAAWQKRFANTDFNSMAVFPLKIDGEVVGTFSLYTDEPDFFDAQELRLLRELAADTSLGLEIIDREGRLYDLVHFDSLTGLPSRHEFNDRLRLHIAQAQNQEKSIAVLVIGVDRLHHIRDELGNSAGDQVLRTVAKHLSSVAGEGNTVARIGANEFAVTFSHINTDLQTFEIVEGLLKNFPYILRFHGDEFTLNVRIGAALYPQDGKEAVQLTENAELAMHHAPISSTENPLAFFSKDMAERVRSQRRMEQHLRHAIEKNEFQLLFQPVVDINNRTVIGCESLLRWHNDELGQVSPDDFIPLAEQNGWIAPIGEWVMTQAFRQAEEWQQRGLPSIRLVVNVSMKQFLQPDFVERVREIKQSVCPKAPASMLGLEITESQLMGDAEQVLAKLKQLRAMGFAIYIDDFGTGYSSLSYLRQLPIDILKIDTSFISDLEHDPSAITMAKGIIALAHSLDLRVIAEGVETAGQLSILEQLKCDYVQGYLFAQPCAVEQVENMMETKL